MPRFKVKLKKLGDQHNKAVREKKDTTEVASGAVVEAGAEAEAEAVVEFVEKAP